MKHSAFTLITGVLLLAASLLIMLISVSVLYLDLNDTQRFHRDYLEVAAMADACMEESLLRLKRDPSFAGTSLSNSGLSCNITLQQTSPGVFVITVVSSNALQLTARQQATVARTVQGQSVMLRISSYTYL